MYIVFIITHTQGFDNKFSILTDISADFYTQVLVAKIKKISKISSCFEKQQKKK